MEAVDPVECVAVEKIRDLVPPEIVDRGVPVGMEAPARIRMLVERGAVEVRKSVRVGGKMRGGPVQDHAKSRRMGAVDEAGKARGLAETARRREKADRLVAPGFVERMLADRQELEMRVFHVHRVGNQLIRQLVVAE